MVVGILSLQGCVDPHIPHFEALSIHVKKIRFPKDCENVDAYVIPGGESSVMLKLIHLHGLREILSKEWREKPVWGICAGAILMAKTVINPSQYGYGLLDFEISRNAYGSQSESQSIKVNGYEVSFIRAPQITKHNPSLEILASYDNTPVWITHKNKMATTFHPELNHSFPSPMHERFVQMIMMG